MKRDYKREMKGRHRQGLEAGLMAVVAALANDEKLSERYKDHALSGTWKNFWCCHVKPDLVLIYRKPGPDQLHLMRLGSHAELRL